MARIMAAVLMWIAAATASAQPFTEGRDYFQIVPAHRTNVARGKVEVLEAFNYGCPYCNLFNPLIRQFKRTLPANAQLAFLPVSFNPGEDFPMFARAFCTADVLGLVDQTHDAMFDAVWKTGELSIEDPGRHVLKNPLPTIEDAARFYNRHAGISVDKFLATAKSFAVEVRLKASDEMVVAYHVPSTPALIINGKYLVSAEATGGANEKMIAIARWLVARETAWETAR